MKPIRPGEKIEVVIKRKEVGEFADDDGGSGETAKGVLAAPPNKRYSPRRIVKKTVLNFYDLGQVKNDDGEFADLDFVIKRPLTAANPFEIIEPTFAEYLTFNDKLFNVPVENWISKYKKIDFENSFKYDLKLKFNEKPDIVKLDADNDKWTDGGLLFPSSVKRIITDSLGLFYKFDTDSDTLKITAENDFDSEAVELNITGDVNVFFSPLLAFNQGQADNAFTTPTHLIFGLNYFYTIFPRRVFLDDEVFVRPNLPFVLGIDAYVNPEDTPRFNYFMDNFKAIPQSRAVRIETTGVNFANISPADFPVPVYPHITADFQMLGSLSEKILLAVISSETKTFFVWTNNHLTYPNNGTFSNLASFTYFA